MCGCGKCSLNTLGRSVPSNFGYDVNFGWSRIALKETLLVL